MKELNFDETTDKIAKRMSDFNNKRINKVIVDENQQQSVVKKEEDDSVSKVIVQAEINKPTKKESKGLLKSIAEFFSDDPKIIQAAKRAEQEKKRLAEEKKKLAAEQKKIAAEQKKIAAQQKKK